MNNTEILNELLEFQSENKTLKTKLHESNYKDQINVRLLKHKSEQITGLQRVLSQWQKDVEWIDIPDCLRKQAGSEIDMSIKE